MGEPTWSRTPTRSKDERNVIAGRVVDGGERSVDVQKELGLSRATLSNWVVSLRKDRARDRGPSVAQLAVIGQRLRNEAEAATNGSEGQGDEPETPSHEPDAVSVTQTITDATEANSAPLVPAPDDAEAVDAEARLRDADGACVAYIEYAARPKPKHTIEQVRAALASMIELSRNQTGVALLATVQGRIDLERELAEHERWSLDKVKELRDGFAAHGRDWCSRRGFSYEALGEVGVPRAMLRKAKIVS